MKRTEVFSISLELAVAQSEYVRNLVKKRQLSKAFNIMAKGKIKEDPASRKRIEKIELARTMKEHEDKAEEIRKTLIKMTEEEEESNDPKKIQKAIIKAHTQHKKEQLARGRT